MEVQSKVTSNISNSLTHLYLTTKVSKQIIEVKSTVTSNISNNTALIYIGTICYDGVLLHVWTEATALGSVSYSDDD